MPFKISAPVVEIFDLEETDKKYASGKDTPTQVTIRKARQHEHATRQDQWNKFERKYNAHRPDEVNIIQDLSFEGIKALEARMVMVSCNIKDEKGKKDLFPSSKKDGHLSLDMTNAEFDLAWGALPPDIVTEIHKYIIQVNPMWGGRRGE